MDFVEKITTKYPYMANNKELATAIVDKAKMFYFALQYPCDPNASEETKPITSFVAQNWVLSACDELIERLGFSSATAYKENGVSWSLDGAQISDRLVGLIKPIIGVV